MRSLLVILMLLFASLLFLAGCSGEHAETPEENGPTTTSTAGTTPGESAVLAIDTSAGERVEVDVEIADSFIERQRGLMERTELAENAGMLFVFDREQALSFWMRNTIIPLSIAYIDRRGRIVDIQDMEPLDETSHPSAEPAQYALEVNQGFFRERGVEVGDAVELPQAGLAASPGSAEVVQAFRDAGLDVGESYPVEQELGWGRTEVPKTYEGGTRFEILSLGSDPAGHAQGGRAFVFGSEGDLATMRNYYENLTGAARPYVYVENNALVQLASQLPQAEAERYGAVLRKIA